MGQDTRGLILGASGRHSPKPSLSFAVLGSPKYNGSSSSFALVQTPRGQETSSHCSTNHGVFHNPTVLPCGPGFKSGASHGRLQALRQAVFPPQVFPLGSDCFEVTHREKAPYPPLLSQVHSPPKSNACFLSRTLGWKED